MDELSISPRLIVEEALKRGYDYIIIDEFTVVLTKNDQSVYLRGSRTSTQSSVGRDIANSKALMKKVFAYFDIPTARSVVVEKESQLSLVTQLTFPVVMKPIRGNHGIGVITGVRTLEEARQRYLNSKESEVLFEETLVGEEYRVLCIDCTFVCAARRIPASIVGDGQHSVRQLIELKNQEPNRGHDHRLPLTKIVIDSLVEEMLRAQGFGLAAIPQLNQIIRLRSTANLSQGGEAVNVTSQVAAENIRLFETIARKSDLDLVGIDVMCEDIGRPLVDQPHAGIIEINASPGIRMHHFPSQGESVNVAALILDSFERKRIQHDI